MIINPHLPVAYQFEKMEPPLIRRGRRRHTGNRLSHRTPYVFIFYCALYDSVV